MSIIGSGTNAVVIGNSSLSGQVWTILLTAESIIWSPTSSAWLVVATKIPDMSQLGLVAVRPHDCLRCDVRTAKVLQKHLQG